MPDIYPAWVKTTQHILRVYCLKDILYTQFNAAQDMPLKNIQKIFPRVLIVPHLSLPQEIVSGFEYKCR